MKLANKLTNTNNVRPEPVEGRMADAGRLDMGRHAHHEC